MMSRQQKRQQREADILAATVELLEERSFLDLRMSDIAKAADCSMGAIYSHFSSKEDLLLGCANTIYQARKPLKNKIFAMPMPPLEKIILLTLTMWAIEDKNPHQFRLQQLAMNPSIWERASTQRTAAVSEFSNEVYESMKAFSRQILESHPTLDYDDELGIDLELGLFSMSWGLYQIKESGFNAFAATFSNGGAKHQHFRMIKRFLKSWDLALEDLDQRLTELSSLAEDLVENR